MKTKIFGLTLVLLLAVVFGCENMFDDSNSNKQKSGNLVIRITDAPFPVDLVDQANITIDRIALKKSGTENSDEDTTSFVVISEEVQTINILDLTNGISAVLAEKEIPEGDYSEIRLRITEAGILPVGETEPMTLKVPSGSTSGLKIKIKPSLTIISGMESSLLLDFDLSRSFKIIGNENSKKGIKGFHFTPVLRAVPNDITGGVYGIVRDTAADTLIFNAQIFLLSGDDTVSTANSAVDGTYAIIGILPGEYSMRCEANNVDTVTVTGKIVESKAQLEVNFDLPQN